VLSIQKPEVEVTTSPGAVSPDTVDRGVTEVHRLTTVRPLLLKCPPLRGHLTTKDPQSTMGRHHHGRAVAAVVDILTAGEADAEEVAVATGAGPFP